MGLKKPLQVIGEVFGDTIFTKKNLSKGRGHLNRDNSILLSHTKSIWKAGKKSKKIFL